MPPGHSPHRALPPPEGVAPDPRPSASRPQGCTKAAVLRKSCSCPHCPAPFLPGQPFPAFLPTSQQPLYWMPVLLDASQTFAPNTGHTEPVTCCPGVTTAPPTHRTLCVTQAVPHSPGLAHACPFSTDWLCRCSPPWISLVPTFIHTLARVDMGPRDGLRYLPWSLGHISGPVAQCTHPLPHAAVPPKPHDSEGLFPPPLPLPPCPPLLPH